MPNKCQYRPAHAGRGGSYLPGIHLPIRKHHWHIVLVHDFSSNSAHNRRISVMALWNILSKFAKAAVGGRILRVAVTDRAIDILG